MNVIIERGCYNNLSKITTEDQNGGAVRRCYYKNGILESIVYYNKNCAAWMASREDGPAKIIYNINGTIFGSVYCNIKYSGFHRLDGPAIHIGNNFNNQWFYKNEEYTLTVNDWLEHNKLNWQEMNKDGFNRMWFEVLD